jgi:hypothetical protein
MQDLACDVALEEIVEADPPTRHGLLQAHDGCLTNMSCIRLYFQQRLVQAQNMQNKNVATSQFPACAVAIHLIVHR